QGLRFLQDRQGSSTPRRAAKAQLQDTTDRYGRSERVGSHCRPRPWSAPEPVWRTVMGRRTHWIKSTVDTIAGTITASLIPRCRQTDLWDLDEIGRAHV